MGRRAAVRRGMIASLFIGLIGAGGCSSTAPSRWPVGADRPGPMRDVDTSHDAGALGRVREWFAGRNAGRIDPSRIP